jgi:hypothetical protein
MVTAQGHDLILCGDAFHEHSTRIPPRVRYEFVCCFWFTNHGSVPVEIVGNKFSLNDGSLFKTALTDVGLYWERNFIPKVELVLDGLPPPRPRSAPLLPGQTFEGYVRFHVNFPFASLLADFVIEDLYRESTYTIKLPRMQLNMASALS